MAMYVKFGTDNIQQEIRESESSPGANWFLVGQTPTDVYGKYFKIVSGSPVQMSQEEFGKMHVDLADKALYWAAKTRKEFLLQESYWAIQEDNNLTAAKRQEWTVYRDAVRAISDTANLATTIWPTPPSN